MWHFDDLCMCGVDTTANTIVLNKTMLCPKRFASRDLPPLFRLRARLSD